MLVFRCVPVIKLNMITINYLIEYVFAMIRVLESASIFLLITVFQGVNLSRMIAVGVLL